MLKTYKDFSPRIEKCLVQSNTKDPLRVLTLKDLSSVFLILGIGLGVSVLVFLLERIVYVYQTRYNRFIGLWTAEFSFFEAATVDFMDLYSDSEPPTI